MKVTEEAIERHRKMVEKAAWQHWQRVRGKTWLTHEDLLQAGYIGLIQGLKRYDPKLGFEEFTFLWPTVYRTIQKEITQNNHTLRVGQRFKNYASRIRASDTQDPHTLAKRLGVSVSLVKKMQEYLGAGFFSMEYPYDEDGESFTLHDAVGKPDNGFAHVEALDNIKSFCISDLDREIVRLRAEGHSLTEIAQMVQDVPGAKWKKSKNMKTVSETLRRLRKRMRKGEQA